MNLLIRFFYQIIISSMSKPIEVNDVDTCCLRVWPNDLDLNFHLNNGRFLSLMDLGRTRLSIRSGLYKKSRIEGWGLGVVGGSNITYLKSLYYDLALNLLLSYFLYLPKLFFQFYIIKSLCV